MLLTHTELPVEPHDFVPAWSTLRVTLGAAGIVVLTVAGVAFGAVLGALALVAWLAS